MQLERCCICSLWLNNQITLSNENPAEHSSLDRNDVHDILNFCKVVLKTCFEVFWLMKWFVDLPFIGHEYNGEVGIYPILDLVFSQSSLSSENSSTC